LLDARAGVDGNRIEQLFTRRPHRLGGRSIARPATMFGHGYLPVMSGSAAGLSGTRNVSALPRSPLHAMANPRPGVPARLQSPVTVKRGEQPLTHFLVTRSTAVRPGMTSSGSCSGAHTLILCDEAVLG